MAKAMVMSDLNTLNLDRLRPPKWLTIIECTYFHRQLTAAVVVVVLLFYVHDKHLRSCRDGQLT